jgi:hypothetical protein
LTYKELTGKTECFGSVTHLPLKRKASRHRPRTPLRPYSTDTNLKTYLEYKQRGVAVLTAHEDEIKDLVEDDNPSDGEETE